MFLRKGKQMSLNEILKTSDYNLGLFSQEAIKALESRIITKSAKDLSTKQSQENPQLAPNTHTQDAKQSYYTTCLIREKELKLTPEEIIRQLYLDKLINEYGYKSSQIQVEVAVQKGRDTGEGKKRIDILVSDEKGSPYIIVELKKPKVKDGQAQLESYLRWLNAPIGVLCNGDSIEEFYHNKEDKNYKTTKLEKLSALPNATQSLDEFLNAKYTLKNLYINDELQTKTLKKIIKDFEDVILANSGVDSFEEIFKLIFTKLYDEQKSAKDFDRITFYTEDKPFTSYKEFTEAIKQLDDSKFRILEFRSKRTEESDEAFRKRLNELFSEAKQEWGGIFESDSGFELTTEELNISVSYLQDIKLFNSNFEVIDDAFEYLVIKGQKSDKGQYFTPRYVIDMCVRMLNPKPHETLIDTASGSCGFPMHAILYVWNKLNPKAKTLLSANEKTKAQKDYVKNVFAIDFDKKSVRIGRLLNKIAGDGESNVLLLNSLHYKQWKNDTRVGNWEKFYSKGFENFERLCADTKSYSKDEKYTKDYSKFNFDIVMANPPFAGDITNENLYKSYDLGKAKISRDILFIERNLNMLKPGGRMAIVLPQGRFNNSSDKYIREFIADKARILAVIGLHGNVFKPHTGTKTSVLFLQKWGGTDEKGNTLCPKKDDYNIFFATMSLPSKDNSGEKIYLKDENGDFVLDTHGHRIVEHDLFNHDGLTQDDIAEAFIDFAKAENLSFYRED